MLNRTSAHIVTLILIIMALTASCGVPASSAPLVSHDLPDSLANRSTPTPDLDEAPTAFRIYMVEESNTLTTVGRDIAHNPKSVLSTLFAGTTPTEVRNNITTAIRRGTSFHSIEINSDNIALVELTEGSLQGLRNQEQRLAAAQIVYTLTQLPEIKSVAFRYPSGWISVQTDNGASVAGQALQRRHYSNDDPRSITFEDPIDDKDDNPPLVIVDEVTPENSSSELSIWLLSQYQALRPVTRMLPRQPEALMDALISGPTESEGLRGFKSSLPDGAFVLSLDIDESTDSDTPRTAFLDLGRGSLPKSKEERYEALGQIVYTLTEALSVEGVIVSVGGTDVPVEDDNGTLPAGARLTRADFKHLAVGFGD